MTDRDIHKQTRDPSLRLPPSIDDVVCQEVQDLFQDLVDRIHRQSLPSRSDGGATMLSIMEFSISDTSCCGHKYVWLLQDGVWLPPPAG
jgi:hypothetical protein